jgi:hypothetical protein
MSTDIIVHVRDVIDEDLILNNITTTIVRPYSNKHTSYVSSSDQYILLVMSVLTFVLAICVNVQQALIVITLAMFFVLIANEYRNTENTGNIGNIGNPDNTISEFANTLKALMDDHTDCQFILIGDNRAAHMVALMCTNTFYLGKAYCSRIKACVCIDGFYSDKRLQETATGKILLTSMFGMRNNYYDVFSIYNITSTTCPFMLIDTTNGNKHTFDFHYALKQSGVFVMTKYITDLQDIQTEMLYFVNMVHVTP